MKKILFIQPLWTKDTKSIFKYLYGIFPPLGIALLASVLEKEGHQVRIIDCTTEEIPPDKITDYINEKYDYIGITSFTQTVPLAYKMAKNIKSVFNDAVIVMGGIHASALPEEVASNPYVDICVRGEGEETIKEIVAGVDIEKIRGISYKKNGKIIHNQKREQISDLDPYPLPAYHLLPMDKYRSMLGVAIKEPSIGLIISRGCPGRCEYCFPNSLGNKVRMKSPKKILEEILLLKNKYGKKEIDFYDDTFTMFKDKITEMCNLLIDNKVDIAWSCCTRADFITKDLLILMKKAGCHQVMYGIESGSSHVREELGKKIRVDFKEIVKMTQKIGIQIRATFMIGNYMETYDDVVKTINYSKYLNTDYAIFNITTPYPGTRLYGRLEKEGRILTKDWTKYDFFNVVFKHPNLSSEEIIKLYKRANKEFYLRPITFLKQLKNLLDPTRARLLFKTGFAVLRGLLNWR